jgi:hypothetical protein
VSSERLFSEATSKEPGNGQEMDKHFFENLLDQYHQTAAYNNLTRRPKIKELWE